MTDKERILLSIVQRYEILHYQQARYIKDGGDLVGAHKAYWINDAELEPGMLVVCETGGIHDWTVGWLVERHGYGHWTIREIGSDRLCDVSNEKFTPINGLSKTEMLEGDQYLFLQKVYKAFRREPHYWYRFGDLTFEGQSVTISIREAFGGLGKDKKSKPFYCTMTWNKKTTIKAILKAMKEAGYGSRSFRSTIEETSTGDQS